MTNVVNFSTGLRTSASSPVSSTKLSSSSTSAPRRLTAFNGQNLKTTRRCRSLSPRLSSSFSSRRDDRPLYEADDAGFEDHDQVVAERNILKYQLARRNEEIKKLKEVVDSALKDLSKVVHHLKEAPNSHEEDGRKIEELPISPEVKSTEKSELQKVQPKTPEVRSSGKRRNDIWGRSNGDDASPPLKKSHLDRITGRSFP